MVDDGLHARRSTRLKRVDFWKTINDFNILPTTSLIPLLRKEGEMGEVITYQLTIYCEFTIYGE